MKNTRNSRGSQAFSPKAVRTETGDPDADEFSQTWFRRGKVDDLVPLGPAGIEMGSPFGWSKAKYPQDLADLAAVSLELDFPLFVLDRGESPFFFRGGNIVFEPGSQGPGPG
jgi:hypothetical protein